MATDIESALAKILYDQADIQAMVAERIYSNRAPQADEETPVGETYLVLTRLSTETFYVLENQFARMATTIDVNIWQQDVDRTSASKLRLLANYIRNRISSDNAEWDGIRVLTCVIDGETDAIERPKEGTDAWWHNRSLVCRIIHDQAIPDHT